MMKRNVKKILALVLALTMLLPLAACGKSQSAGGASPTPGARPQETAAPEFVYTAETRPFVQNTEDWINVRSYNDNGMYYTKLEKIGEREHGDSLPRWEGEFDLYGTFLYFRDPQGRETRVEAYSPMEPVQDEQNRRDFVSTTDMAGICFAADGFVTIEIVNCSWSEGDGGYAEYSEEYWANQRYTQQYYIRWFDPQGHELSCAPVEVSEDSWLNAYNMKLDEQGNVLVTDGMGLRAIGPDGQDAYTIRPDGYIDGLIQLPDGRIAAVIYDEQEMLCFLDSAQGKLKDGIAVDGLDVYNAVPGNSEYELYYSNGSNFYGCKLGEEPVRLFSWLSCDVNGNSISVLRVRPDGAVECLANTYDDESRTYSYELVTVKKVPYDSVPHKETIRMAAMYLDYRVQEMIIKFNRSNDRYRIEVTDYSEYNNDRDGWDAGQTKLNTEILSGNVPDLFCLNGLNYSQLAARGILEDLYPYLDADPELNRSDFFSNVLQAFEVNGKLCQTVSGFYITSAIGAASVVGDRPGWTYDEFNAALASMPDGCTAFDQYVTRDAILQTCLALDMADFVDWSTGRVNFDSEQFVSLLEFANSFPADFDWEHYDYSQEDSLEDRLARGMQMLVQTSAYSLEDIFYNNYTRFLGGEITYIGYPTSHGTGNMLSLAEAGYAMSSRSPYKDVIWEFLRGFFTEQYQRGSYCLPSRVDVFEHNAEQATTVQYQTDADGNVMLDEQGERIPVVRYSMWNSVTGQIEEIYALEQAQVDQIRDLIETTTKAADYDQAILAIVSEQAAPYFAGQKSAQEVARLIQSKANIYVNEQR